MVNQGVPSSLALQDILWQYEPVVMLFPVCHIMIRILASYIIMLLIVGAAVQHCRAAEMNEPVPAYLSDLDIMQQYGEDISRAIPSLLESLASPDPSIRRNAAFALGEMGSDAAPAVSALADALENDTDIEVRRNAAFALGEIGSPSLSHLMSMLNDSDSRIRRNVAAALVRIGKPAIPDLIRAMGSTDQILRRNAVGILGRIGPDARIAVPQLKQALNDPDKAFCWTVKQALKKIENDSPQDMRAKLRHADPAVRSSAAEALGDNEAAGPGAVKALIDCLNDDSAAVRQEAAFALAEIGAPAVEDLLQALQENDAVTRKNAAFSLGEMGQAAVHALPALKNLLNDTDKQVRWCADIAIKKISGSGE